VVIKVLFLNEWDFKHNFQRYFDCSIVSLTFYFNLLCLNRDF